ncbi:CLUMA_CG018097, isoform A, partial [Clunio marinus]
MFLKVLSTLTFMQLFCNTTSQMLDKKFSNLSSIKIKEFEANDNWQIIDLSHNSITSFDFPELLEKQTQLDTLRLNNNLKFIVQDNEKILEQSALGNFECKMCGFVNIQSQHFTGFSNLTKLYLNDNRISRISESAFASNENLKLLDLSGNDLKDVPQILFVGLKSFETLNLASNPILIPKNRPFLKSNSLKYLKMNHCNVSTIYLETFSELSNIETLNLNENRIGFLPVNSFKYNKKLKSLLIESNQIRSFPVVMLDTLPQLVELCIDKNILVESPELGNFLQRYDERRLRTDNCNDNVKYFIENLSRIDVKTSTFDETSQNTNTSEKSSKFVTKFINQGISDFFIGSYIMLIIIVQAAAIVLLTIYLIKITKYEKLEG